MNMFRPLRADEIDCRIAQIKSDMTGLSLLLYKDARCDQNILDETVGNYNWQRSHSRDNANCTVSIWDKDKGMWISKEDTGTESNTEKEKGLASDSFKRACFNWGIGRELYTAPFIWIPKEKCNIEQQKNGRLTCYDRFTVTGIGYTDGVITGLEIKNQKTGKICFTYGKIKDKVTEKPEKPDNEPDTIPPRAETQETNPPKQTAPAEVSKVGKVPDVNPVKKYLSNELVFMGQMFGIADKQEMLTKFMAMRTALIEMGVIDSTDSDHQTMEQAKTMINAMYEHFTPSGSKNDRTA